MLDIRNLKELHRVVEIGRDMNVSGRTMNVEDVNLEYARGQAELICEMFAIDLEERDYITELITQVPEQDIEDAHRQIALDAHKRLD